MYCCYFGRVGEDEWCWARWIRRRWHTGRDGPRPHVRAAVRSACTAFASVSRAPCDGCVRRARGRRTFLGARPGPLGRGCARGRSAAHLLRAASSDGCGARTVRFASWLCSQRHSRAIDLGLVAMHGRHPRRRVRLSSAVPAGTALCVYRPPRVAFGTSHPPRASHFKHHTARGFPPSAVNRFTDTPWAWRQPVRCASSRGLCVYVVHVAGANVDATHERQHKPRRNPTRRNPTRHALTARPLVCATTARAVSRGPHAGFPLRLDLHGHYVRSAACLPFRQRRRLPLGRTHVRVNHAVVRPKMCHAHPRLWFPSRAVKLLSVGIGALCRALPR